ncbi:MAG: DUF3108 domain-containing protein [Bacteroidia bacterium]|nr:DUF3108 domain-containing protein [Bacteroidia bacterium]MCZ2277964.1 DUF3108 domain-containing protein [Bacteroidia bacterium]
MKRSRFLVVSALVLAAHPISAEEEVFKKVPNHAFTLNEALEYRVHYGLINAGEARLEVQSDIKTRNGRKTYHVIGTGKTTGMFDWFFKVRDRYESYIDTQSLLPVHFVRRVNEGGYIINQDVDFNHYENKAVSQKATINVPDNIQDLISAYYYARNLNFDTAKTGSVYPLSTYLDDEVIDLKLKYIGKEKIKVSAGTFNCLKFRPVLQKGRVFKEQEGMTIWISDDKNKIVIRAEAEILVGSVKMDLKQYSGLANSLSSKTK